MKLADYKLFFIAIGLIGLLLIASPLIAKIISSPVGERFSELYLLGPECMAENYPSNIAIRKDYLVYVGVGNHQGASSYYSLKVKLLNATDALPNRTSQNPSPSIPICEYRFSIPEGKNWESPLTFSVKDASINNNQSIIRKFTINGVSLDVHKPGLWDTNSSIYRYMLLCELWLYDAPTNSVQFDNRFVTLQLNLATTI